MQCRNSIDRQSAIRPCLEAALSAWLYIAGLSERRRFLWRKFYFSSSSNALPEAVHYRQWHQELLWFPGGRSIAGCCQHGLCCRQHFTECVCSVGGRKRRRDALSGRRLFLWGQPRNLWLDSSSPSAAGQSGNDDGSSCWRHADKGSGTGNDQRQPRCFVFVCQRCCGRDVCDWYYRWPDGETPDAAVERRADFRYCQECGQLYHIAAIDNTVRRAG